ncbi:MAG: hypothetical protein ABIZ04_23865 [Opitutus sp.]
MKTKIPTLALTLVALTVHTPSAFAQAAGAASGAAQNAAAAANQNANAASHAANAAAANASAGAQASVAHSPAATGATSRAAAATTAAGATIPTTKGTVNAGVANSATVPGNRANDPTMTVNGNGRGSAAGAGVDSDAQLSASLNSQATAAHIRNATTANREESFKEVETGIASAKRSLAGMRSANNAPDKAGRVQLKAAAEEVRSLEKTLRQSLSDARHATGNDVAAAQAKLAADYEAYLAAVARNQASVSGSVAAPVDPKR